MMDRYETISNDMSYMNSPGCVAANHRLMLHAIKIRFFLLWKIINLKRNDRSKNESDQQ